MSELMNNFGIFLNGILTAITEVYQTLSSIEIFQIVIFVLIIGLFVLIWDTLINVNRKD